MPLDSGTCSTPRPRTIARRLSRDWHDWRCGPELFFHGGVIAMVRVGPMLRPAKHSRQVPHRGIARAKGEMFCGLLLAPRCIRTAPVAHPPGNERPRLIIQSERGQAGRSWRRIRSRRAARPKGVLLILLFSSPIRRSRSRTLYLISLGSPEPRSMGGTGQIRVKVAIDSDSARPGLS
jgi:hypothetical protein